MDAKQMNEAKLGIPGVGNLTPAALKVLKNFGEALDGLTELSESVQMWKDAANRLQGQLDRQREEITRLQQEVTEPITLQGAGFSLASALADAVVAELDSVLAARGAGIGKEETRAIVLKYATRYFANAQDTSDKLAQAFEELHAKRWNTHKARIEGMEAIYSLAVRTFTRPGIARTEETVQFLKDASQLMALNQPRSEDITPNADEASKAV